MSKLCPTCEQITIFEICFECLKCKTERKERIAQRTKQQETPIVFDPDDPTYFDPWK